MEADSLDRGSYYPTMGSSDNLAVEQRCHLTMAVGADIHVAGDNRGHLGNHAAVGAGYHGAILVQQAYAGSGGAYLGHQTKTAHMGR